MQLFISHLPNVSAPALASPLFDPPEPQNIEKTVFRDFPSFSRTCICLLLIFPLLTLLPSDFSNSAALDKFSSKVTSFEARPTSAECLPPDTQSTQLIKPKVIGHENDTEQTKRDLEYTLEPFVPCVHSVQRTHQRTRWLDADTRARVCNDKSS